MPAYEDCVIATRIKIESMIQSYLRRIEVDEVLSPYRHDKRGAAKIERARARALNVVTYQAGAYLAHSRREFSYEDIKRILRDAGGDTNAVDNMQHHLVIWRDNGGHDDKQLSLLDRMK
jgi:hypothetical protein